MFLSKFFSAIKNNNNNSKSRSCYCCQRVVNQIVTHSLHFLNNTIRSTNTNTQTGLLWCLPLRLLLRKGMISYGKHSQLIHYLIQQQQQQSESGTLSVLLLLLLEEVIGFGKDLPESVTVQFLCWYLSSSNNIITAITNAYTTTTTTITKQNHAHKHISL